MTSTAPEAPAELRTYSTTALLDVIQQLTHAIHTERECGTVNTADRLTDYRARRALCRAEVLRRAGA